MKSSLKRYVSTTQKIQGYQKMTGYQKTKKNVENGFQ